MSRTVGIRVAALSHTSVDTAYVFGYGVYEGDFPIDPEAGGFNFGQTNPRIRLDSGKVVWGCECWWGPEDVIRDRIKNLKIVEVDIDEKRKQELSDRVEVKKE